jgi:hypothetical protein
MATDGLYPGLFTPWSMSVLGVLEVEINIEPVRPSLPGGSVTYTGAVDKYKVTIVVRHKGKVWRYEKTVTQFIAKVWAKILRITLRTPTIDITALQHRTNDSVNIKVTKK